MPMMPEVLAEARENASVRLSLRVPPALECFAGHFPGQPILPGVVQIHWAVRLARRHFDGLEDSYGVLRFKCRAPVLPGTELQLVLGCDAARSSVTFAFSDAQRTVSSGKILFR
jgi:3-hydroxymyristoyl/3-hydroxydecanoyl-(acyl carrier protein) dehydratase